MDNGCGNAGCRGCGRVENGRGATGPMRSLRAGPKPGVGVTAAVARVLRGSLGNTLRIAGEFKPFQDVDIHAKVAGYIRSINVDVGDHVKQGQTIAVLEVPELAAQLSEPTLEREARKIRFERRREICSGRNRHSRRRIRPTSRLKQAADSRAGLVAQQEVDDSQAKDLESAAQVASAEAELFGRQTTTRSSASEPETIRGALWLHAHHRSVRRGDHESLRGHRSADRGGDLEQHAGDSGRAAR